MICGRCILGKTLINEGKKPGKGNDGKVNYVLDRGRWPTTEGGEYGFRRRAPPYLCRMLECGAAEKI
jgi:hypothetical protein